MQWIPLAPQYGQKQASERFRNLASKFAATLVTANVVRNIRAEFNRMEDNVFRAAGLLLCDLYSQGHLVRLRRGVVQFSAVPITSSEDANPIKTRLIQARSHQLRSSAVREFISNVEKRRFHAGAWTSIFSVMRDGSALSEELRKVRSGLIRSSQVIDPYIQVVEAGSMCEFTGLELLAIWRYFRHTWANPYQSVPGRSFMVLIRDGAARNHPVIGVGALASSAVQLAVRDMWIGWNPEQVVAHLQQSASEIDMKWLAETIEKGIDEIYLDDLLDPNLTPLNRRHLRLPTSEIVRWLQRYGSEQRKLHRQNGTSSEHKASISQSPDNSSWRTRAETALFRGKRAEALAILLRAKHVIQGPNGAIVSPEQFRKRLQLGEPRQGIQSLLRRVKAERVGVAVADISVCGGVPPYSVLTGGKLVAMLLASPEIVLAYTHRYSQAQSIIASSIAGRPIIRASHLVFLGTTSLYGTEPNQYTRVSVPCEFLGGVRGESIRYIPLGRTEGYGTFQFSDGTVEALSDAVAQYRGGRRVNSIFGEGVNPRLRKIRDGLDLLGMDSDEMLMHGHQRLVYGIPLARNFKEYLMGRESEPDYLFSLTNVEDRTKSIAGWWAERWLARRIERDDVLDEVAQHRLTYPIRHGARVQMPADMENLDLPFGDFAKEPCDDLV
jgi:hypothetical protein